jgi:hypothetical protein
MGRDQWEPDIDPDDPTDDTAQDETAAKLKAAEERAAKAEARAKELEQKAAAKPAESPRQAADPNKPLTQADMARIVQEAQLGAQTMMARRQLEAAIDESMKSSDQTWYEKQPAYVRQAVAGEISRRVSEIDGDKLRKMTDAEFEGELRKTAEAVMKEQAKIGGTAGSKDELDARLSANRAAGTSSGASARAENQPRQSGGPMEVDIDNPTYGISENIRWPTEEEVDMKTEREFKADLRKAGVV